jgi:hypothetical protein
MQPADLPFVEPLDLPRKLPDRLMRQSLLRPANLRDFLTSAAGNLAGGFDCDRARLIEREYPLPDWRRREADLPFEVPYIVEGASLPALVLVLLEHQSDTDPLLPLRMLLFLAGYWGRQWEQWLGHPRPRGPLRLHPVLPVLLYTGSAPWGSTRRLEELLGEPAAFHAFAPGWEPVIWNLAERTPEALLTSGAPWLQMLAVLRAGHLPEAEYLGVFEEVERRLAPLADQDEVRWRELVEMTLAYATWRRPGAEREALVEAARRANPGRGQEVSVMANTIAEELLEQGRNQGRAEGRAEGVRGMLLRLLHSRFGELPPDLIRRLEGTTDAQKLQALFDQALALDKIEDLPV